MINSYGLLSGYMPYSVENGENKIGIDCQANAKLNVCVLVDKRKKEKLFFFLKERENCVNL